MRSTSVVSDEWNSVASVRDESPAGSYQVGEGERLTAWTVGDPAMEGVEFQFLFENQIDISLFVVGERKVCEEVVECIVEVIEGGGDRDIVAGEQLVVEGALDVVVCDDLIEEFAEGGVLRADRYLLSRGGNGEKEEDEYRVG